MESSIRTEAQIRKTARIFPVFWLLIFAFLLTSFGTSHAANCTPAAKLISAQGQVEKRSANFITWKSVQSAQTFCQGDAIKTGNKGRAAVRLVNETLIRLDKNTTVTFTEIAKENPSLLELIKGVIHSISRTPRSLDIHTPFVNAAIEGTEFVVGVYENNSRITVFEGKVIASNEAGSQTITANQVVEATAGQAPTERIDIHPRDAVTWALYYPPLVEAAVLSPENKLDPNNPLHEALRFYAEGDSLKALAFIDNIPGELDISQHLAAAGINLSVGDIEAAEQHLHKLLQLNPNNTDGLALQTIIAVTQNDLKTADSVSSHALSINPDSAMALLAQSYLDQAHFDIDAALKHSEQAAEQAPDSGTALARLAEVQLMHGLTAKAQTSAHKAALKSPHDAHIQSVFGFASLRSTDLKAAETAFKRAQNLNSAAPLPHFGLGLIKIRRNQLREGRESLEHAALLDPSNALLRSYLGKAYYEEKRSQRAADQFELAKTLDPNDPTAWFYDSILLQSLNRPVEALNSQQQAIKKNSNRAVYRSQQLLDKDEAARSVSLGRIYNDLGAQQLARTQAINALTRNPNDYSAHRLLADSMLGSNRHDNARLSELLQAQVLQPLNLMPLQPQLNESNLGLLDGAGPSSLSYNEYNPMFIRNGLYGQINAGAAEKNSWGDDVVIAGLQDKLAFSLGQYHFETGDFDENNDFDKDIYNLFAQASLTDNSSLQLEFRQEEEVKGLVAQRFLPLDPFDTNERRTTEKQVLRLSLKHDLDVSTQLLFSAIHEETDSRSKIIMSGFDIYNTESFHKPSHNFYELQGNHQFNNFNLMMGGAYTENKTSRITHIDIQPCPFPGINAECQIQTNGERAQLKVYSYLQHSPRTNLNLIYGLAWSKDKSNKWNENIKRDLGKDHILPKVALSWRLRPQHQLRAAAYKMLSPVSPASSYRTLEPTQIAGFNQIVDESPYTPSDNYGLALDSQLTETLDGGFEIIYRDASVPLALRDTTNSSTQFFQEISNKTQSGSVYMNWRPAPGWGVGLSYEVEDYSQNTDDQQSVINALMVDGVLDLKTQRVPLTLSYFHPSGLTLSLDASRYHQTGRYIANARGATVETGRDKFWLADLNAAWRLPKRAGSISLGIKNLFDQTFRFEDRNSYETLDINVSATPSTLSPNRLFYGRISFSFR